MKVNLDSVFTGNGNIYNRNTTGNVKETFGNNSNHITRFTKYDKQGRDVDTFEYCENEIISHQHKKYTHDGCIETYKSKNQEYIREIKTFVKDSFTHHIEKFTSKTSPQSNYVNEFIRDVTGKLVKVINNGKVLNLK